MPEMRWSAAWTVDPLGPPTTVVLGAGGDRQVAVDGLDEATTTAVQRWASGAPVVARGVEQSRLLDVLVDLGAVVPTVGGASISLLGDDPVVAVLGGAAAATGLPPGEAGLVVVVRSGTDWPRPPAHRLHLGLDVTLHHTVLLGPLVVPGASACLDCVRTRTERRWGRPVLPATPAMTQRPAVVAELLAVHVRLALAGHSPLVNATIAWDLEQGSCERQSVFKVPGCATCDRAPATGRVVLPSASGAGGMAVAS